jgi:hypothetical protein
MPPTQISSSTVAIMITNASDPKDPTASWTPRAASASLWSEAAARAPIVHSASHNPNSEVRNADTFGVLKLTLHTKSDDWKFLPEEGKAFKDSGSEFATEPKLIMC